ncbi:alpha/beta hydrolase [Solihabitans fulvus]|uniref:Alpha/beta hydrolase n=1 Tax=Solihabitans fulvus TaxID=1892852 RepID=A0A5B2X335_9PSEU|nr:alpha/beta hydrolase [Solihabitans fulvus]KAA2257532.1 alpha/beta hydrolase [Solihabitans fulvus]
MRYANTFAYRRFGPTGGVPLLLTNRFRATTDHWDPALLDVLARERDVIVFDNLGVGQTPGDVPDSIPAMADGAAAFLRALGTDQVDVLGWSMGGMVAQALALHHPDLVRRLVVAGSGPGGVPDAPSTPDRVWPTALKPENDDEDFLYLFFPESPAGRAAGIESLGRLRPGAHVTAAGVRAQFAAIREWSGSGAWDRLPDLDLPVLVAAGAQDVMAHPYLSYAMSQRLPDATLTVYGRSGHAFLFQYADAFGRQVLDFLR